MAGNNYGKNVVELDFKDGPRLYRQVTEVSGEAYDLDFHVRYGTYMAGGQMGIESYGQHRHDFNQVNFWLGTDTNSIGDLGAEVELCIGEEWEKHMITTSTAVAIPGGLPHYPAMINKIDRRFIYVEVSCAREYSEEALPATKKKPDEIPVTGWNSRYRPNIINLAFTRKGPWSYGPTNRDDSGGHLAFIRSNTPGFDFLIMCESLKKAPYRFGPNPEKPHAHPMTEILFFVGTDTDSLGDLGGEAEIYLGKEMEKHVITRPTAVVIPDKLAHCPLTITRVDRPFYLMDVRPFGTEIPGVGKL
ncbi:MAG TPA: hypothetical protein G4O16_00890 [Dehalococcoidia bacterium]|nr:hypothetical protein [Dehalococcoidia bacterium]